MFAESPSDYHNSKLKQSMQFVKFEAEFNLHVKNGNKYFKTLPSALREAITYGQYFTALTKTPTINRYKEQFSYNKSSFCITLANHNKLFDR